MTNWGDFERKLKERMDQSQEYEPGHKFKEREAYLLKELKFPEGATDEDKKKIVYSIAAAQGRYQPRVGGVVCHPEDPGIYYVRSIENDQVSVGIEGPEGSDVVKELTGLRTLCEINKMVDWS